MADRSIVIVLLTLWVIWSLQVAQNITETGNIWTQHVQLPLFWKFISKWLVPRTFDSWPMTHKLWLKGYESPIMNGYQKGENSGTDVLVHNASNLSSGIELVSFEIIKMSFQIEKIRLHWMDASFHCSYSICKFFQSTDLMIRKGWSVACWLSVKIMINVQYRYKDGFHNKKDYCWLKPLNKFNTSISNEFFEEFSTDYTLLPVVIFNVATMCLNLILFIIIIFQIYFNHWFKI